MEVRVRSGVIAVSVVAGLVGGAVASKIPDWISSAQAQSAAYRVSIAADKDGLWLFDNASGAITYCTSSYFALTDKAPLDRPAEPVCVNARR